MDIQEENNMEDKDLIKIFDAHQKNIDDAVKNGNYEPEKYVMGNTLNDIDNKLNDYKYEEETVSNDKNKREGIVNLGIQGMTEEEYNMYNFANGLDNYTLYTPTDNKNYKVSSAWNWFGAGADSKITTDGIIKRINGYIDNLYNKGNGLSDGQVEIELSDWWLKGLTNGSNKFISEVNGIKSVSNGNDRTLYKGDTKLFTFRELSKDDSTPNDKGKVIFYDTDKTSAYLLFSELYNNIASDRYMQKFFRNGADDGLFTKQFGDEFEETGDMMANVKSYVKDNLSYYRNKKDKVYKPGEQYFYARADGSLVSGLGTRGQADIALKVMDGYFQATKTSSMINPFTKVNEDKYMRDWATAMGNIGNLYIEAESGDDFDPTENQSVIMDPLLDSSKRRLIMEDVYNNFADCQFVLNRHGLHWGYEITVPESDDSKLWGTNGKGKGNHVYKVFVEGALDTDFIDELKSRPENIAHSEVLDCILNNSPYEYTSVDVLHNFNINDKRNGIQSVNAIEYGGAFNAFYNQNTGQMQFSWHANDGNYYNLNEIFGSSEQANKALEQYLTVIENIHNYKDALYTTSTSNDIVNHIKLNNLFKDKYNENNEFIGSGAITNYLTKVGDSGLSNIQILSIFANPNAAKAIMHAQGSKQGQLLIMQNTDNIYRSIMKYNQNYDIEDFNKWFEGKNSQE